MNLCGQVIFFSPFGRKDCDIGYFQGGLYKVEGRAYVFPLERLALCCTCCIHPVHN